MTGMIRHPPNGRPRKTQKYRMRGDVVTVSAVLEMIVITIPMSKDFLTPILSMEKPTSNPYIEVRLPMMP